MQDYFFKIIIAAIITKVDTKHIENAAIAIGTIIVGIACLSSND